MRLPYLILALILIGALGYAIYHYRLSIVPSWEGLNSGIEGVEINGQFYRIDDALPDGYWWERNDPHSVILVKDLSPWDFWGPGAVRVEVQNPVPSSDPYLEGRKVSYYIKQGDQYIYVEGEVVTYEMYVTISAHDTGAFNQMLFDGEKFWVALVSLTWNKAYQKYVNRFGKVLYGQAWEAPLAVLIEEYEVRDCGDHCQVDPSYEGRFITLYTSPKQEGTVSDLGLTTGGDINATLSHELSPDTRLSRVAYFSITLSDFGISERLWGKVAPVIDMKLKIYALRLGKFTFTAPEDLPEWEDREPESKGWGVWLGEIFTNPLTWFFMAGIIIIIILVLIIVAGATVPIRRGASKVSLALIGIMLVGLATVLQMIIDWYQSYAYGVPMPKTIQALVVLAGLLSLIAVVISLKSKPLRKT